MAVLASKTYFRLDAPAVGENHIVVEVPHAGLLMDPTSMALCTAPVSSIARDADLYMDELLSGCISEGATVLTATASRYLLDLNRDQNDFDRRAADGGQQENRPFGLIWRETTDGSRALALPLTTSELQRRLDLVYRPYHRALDDIIQRKQQRFGHVIVLSAHSMPTVSFHKQSPQPHPRCPDIAVGTRFGKSASERVTRIALQHARVYGWTVRRDDPFAGGATTERHGAPRQGIDAVQVEVARRLYMNERSLGRKPDSFQLMASFWRELVAKLATTHRG